MNLEEALRADIDYWENCDDFEELQPETLRGDIIALKRIEYEKYYGKDWTYHLIGLPRGPELSAIERAKEIYMVKEA